MTNHTTELEPCPFCGGEADPEGWLMIDAAGNEIRGPECDDCGATARSKELWNTRHRKGKIKC